jgi:TP901 family phage tail tape measure protein
MAKTTKQTEAELKQLSDILGELSKRAQEVRTQIDRTADFGQYNTLLDKLMSINNAYLQIAQSAEKTRTSLLRDVGTISPATPAKPKMDFSGLTVDEEARRLEVERIKTSSNLAAIKAKAAELRALRNEAQQATSQPNILSGVPATPPVMDEEAFNASLGRNTKAKKDNTFVTKELTDAQIKARETTIQYANAVAFANQVEQKTGARFDQSKTVMSQGGINGRTVFDFQGIDESTGAIRRLQIATDEAGNVFPQVQRRFRDFAQGVLRDVGELTKWTLAIGLIYGPLQKLQEITSLMIENEVKLAEASIAVNAANDSTSKIFDTVAESADRAGESIDETIQAFTSSYRAVGGATNEVDRFSAATDLMNDALTLSKLSSLNAAQSIDNLAAAVKQSGGDFDSASHMLDSWVKVTRMANVDLATLAIGVATLGDAAETAGIDTDHLNGIIAVLAENSNLSGQEVANAARALVSGLQSQQAQKALQDVGIATKDANGELRNFLDVIQQIREYSAGGLISETQMAAITLAAGGGTRRQSTYSAFIRNSGDIGSIAAASASANGEAQEALARQTETAQTAIVRLDNSFQDLAQTLGSEGGFLQIFKDITNTTSLLVEGMNGLVAITGKATPELIALGAAAAYVYSRTDPASTQNMINRRLNSSIAGGINRVLGTDELDARFSAASQGLSRGVSTGQQTADFLTGSGRGSRAFQGIAAAAIPAIYNATSGEKFGMEKAGADIAGGIVGSLVGGPVGAVIGTSIAEAFVRATTSDTQLENYFKDIAVTAVGESVGTPSTKAEADKLLMESQITPTLLGVTAKQFSLGTGIGAEFFGNVSATLKTAALNAILAVNNLKPGETNQVGPLSVEQVSMMNATEEGRAAYQAFLDSTKNKGLVQGQDSLFKQRTDAIGSSMINGTTTNAFIDSIVKERLSELDAQRASGKLKTTDYQSMTIETEGAKAAGEGYFAGFGKEFMDAAKINSTAEAYKALLDILTYGSGDSKNNLNQLNASIIELINLGDSITPEQRDKLASLQNMAGKFAADALTEARLSQVNPANIVGNVNDPRTSAESELVMQRTRELEKQFYGSEEGGGLSEADMNAYLKKNFEEAAEPIKDSTTLFYKMLEAFDPRFRSLAEEQLKKEGKLSDDGGGGIGFQQYKNVDRATLETAAKQSLTMGQDWKEKFGYDFKPDDQIAIARDGIAKPLHADFKIMQLLLEKLVDLGQKELDGMYNIPEGATFWVPLTAAYYGKGGAGGELGTDIETGLEDIKTADGEKKDIPQYTDDLFPGDSGRTMAKAWLDKQTAQRLTSSADMEDKYKYPAGDMEKMMENRYKDWGKNGALGTSGAAPSTRLALNIQNTTSVLLDGRLIASIVKTYLAEDLVRASSGSGSSTKNYVI